MATVTVLQFDSFGNEDQVYAAKIPKPAIKKDTEILIRVKAGVINPADVLYIAGHYVVQAKSFPARIGMEGAGIIEEAGKSSGYKVGQRVHFVDTGSWAEYIVLDTSLPVPTRVIAIPDGVSYEEGAQLTINPICALAMFDEVGVKKGEFLLQTAASSAQGRIIIALAKEKGIKTINIVRRDEHIAGLKAIGADYVINSEKEDLIAKVKEIAPQGVQGAFDAVTGKLGADVLKTVAVGGKVLVYGVLGGFNMDINVLDLLFKSQTLKGFFMYKYINDHSEAHVLAMYQEVIDSILAKKLHLSYKSFDGASQYKEGLKHSQTPGKAEKSIFTF